MPAIRDASLAEKCHGRKWKNYAGAIKLSNQALAPYYSYSPY